jgi:hypothetical protein
MAKGPVKRTAAARKPIRPRKPPVEKTPAEAVAPSQEQPGAPASFETLKQNMKKIDKGGMAGALKRVKNMKSEGWRDPKAVRELTETIAQDIGLKVDPKRIDAFMNAFHDATKNADETGPKLSVEDIAKKYAADKVDDRTLKEIKKFVK